MPSIYPSLVSPIPLLISETWLCARISTTVRQVYGTKLKDIENSELISYLETYGKKPSHSLDRLVALSDE